MLHTFSLLPRLSIPNAKSQFLVSYSSKILQIPLALLVEFLSLLLAKTHSLIRHIPFSFLLSLYHPPPPDSPPRRKLKLRGSSWKGQTQVFASRPFYITADREPYEPWEMLHRSRHIMRQSESHIKLFTYAANGSLLLSSPHLLTCPLHQPLEELTRANVSLSSGNSSLDETS